MTLRCDPTGLVGCISISFECNMDVMYKYKYYLYTQREVWVICFKDAKKLLMHHLSESWTSDVTAVDSSHLNRRKEDPMR